MTESDKKNSILNVLIQLGANIDKCAKNGEVDLKMVIDEGVRIGILTPKDMEQLAVFF